MRDRWWSISRRWPGDWLGFAPSMIQKWHLLQPSDQLQAFLENHFEKFRLWHTQRVLARNLKHHHSQVLAEPLSGFKMLLKLFQHSMFKGQQAPLVWSCHCYFCFNSPTSSASTAPTRCGGWDDSRPWIPSDISCIATPRSRCDVKSKRQMNRVTAPRVQWWGPAKTAVNLQLEIHWLRGTPKSSILVRSSLKNHIHVGVPPFVETPN